MNEGDASFNRMASGMAAATGTIFQPTAPTAKVDSEVPTGQDELFKSLKSRAYADCPAHERGPHPTRGPHTKFGWSVHVFLDPYSMPRWPQGMTRIQWDLQQSKRCSMKMETSRVGLS